MANEDLGLKLSAEVTKFVDGLLRASKSADALAVAIVEAEKAVVASIVRMQAAARQSLGKTVASFVSAEGQIDAASKEIEADAKGVATAMLGMGKAADKGATQFEKAAGRMKSSAGGIGSAISSGAASADGPLADLGARFDALGERVRGTVLNIQTAILGLGAVRFGQEAVGAASEFEAALGQVKIVAGDSGKSIQELQGFLVGLSKTTPIGLVDLTKSLGDAIGKLPKGANQAALAIDALNAAQAAARASGSSAGQVLDGIIPILNTYGQTGITAAQITDKLFAAFDQGGATVPELSASLGQIVGISSQFGISIDELLGSIAVLTRGGQTASEAITNLRQALISTARPPENVKKQLDALGVSAELFSTQSLKSNGLIGVLEQLQAKGGATQLEKLYTDTQGFLGVSTLLGAGLGQVREDIDLIGKSAGKTDAAVATIANNFDQLAGIAKNRLGAVLIDIGERIMPTVARVLGQLADYAEKNGDQIATGIGEAVEALARFGEFVVSYGPEILSFLVAVKGTSWFVGLANDIAVAAMALRTFSQGLAASDALGKGLASLGAQGGESFLGGMKSTLKGAGGVLSAAFRSPGIAAAIAGVATVGYEIGTALMEALGDAIEEGTQRQIKAAIDSLDAEISGRLKAIGARTVDEAADIRRRLTSGQAVQSGGRVQTLREVQQGGGDVQAAFNAGLAAIAQQVDAARAASARNAATMAEAAAKVEELQRRQVGGAELAAAEAAFGQQQAAVRASAERVAQLTEGSKALVAQYTEVTQASAKQAAGAGGVAVQAVKATKQAQDDAQKLATDLLAQWQAENGKLDALRLERLRLEQEALQNEADAALAAYEAETDAKLASLDAMDAGERASTEYRAQREREMSAIIDRQNEAIRNGARVRIEEARAAAEAETSAARDSAETQRAIAENLALQEANINADALARIAEANAAQRRREADADAAFARAKLADAQRNAERMAEVERNASVRGRAESLTAGLSSPEGGAQMTTGLGLQAGLGADAAAGLGGAVAVLPAINEAAKAIGDLFGGDVDRLRKESKDAAAEATSLEASLKATRKRNADEIERMEDELAAKRKAGLSDAEEKVAEDRIDAAKEANALEEDALQRRVEAANAEADALAKAADEAVGGLEAFFSDFFANVDRALVGMIEGLPQAIDRVVNEALPAFIEAFVAGLPKLYAGLIVLAPRIAFAIVKSIVYTLPIALYKGAVDAGRSIIEFLTTGLVGRITNALGVALADIGVALYDGIVGAFAAAGAAIVDGITAVFQPIIDFFSNVFDTAGGLFSGDDSTAGRIGRSLGLSAGAKILTGNFDDLSEKDIPVIGGFFHQGGSVSSSGSDPGSAALLAASGAPRFADGGMVRRLNSLARRRLSQVLGGDDVPALLSPGEGVLTQQGVAAVGGPGSLDAINRGNAPAAGAAQPTHAQVVLSARVGGDRALAALVSRIVSVSMATPGGAVRTAIDDANRATVVPGVAWV